MAQYALDRVLSVAGTYAATNSKKGITAGEVAMICDQVTEPTLNFTAETEDIVDARNNVAMVLENGRGATFGFSNAFFNTGLLAQQVGGVAEAVTGAEFTKYDILTVGADKTATIGATPSGDAVSKVYKLNKDGSFTNAAALTVTTDYTYADGKITGVTLAEGDKILVVYTAKADGEQITALADASNELLNVTAEVLLRELCNEELYYAFLVFRGKLNGEAEWAMQRDSQHGAEFRIMPEYCSADRKLVDIIIVRGEDLIA